MTAFVGIQRGVYTLGRSYLLWWRHNGFRFNLRDLPMGGVPSDDGVHPDRYDGNDRGGCYGRSVRALSNLEPYLHGLVLLLVGLALSVSPRKN